jgi:AmmeMemoRadiSam system protein B
MIRHPYAAGYFYPGSAAELKTTIARLVDKKAPKEEAIGLLVPHAGYQYSGAVAGATISRIVIKDTFIIIGPSHSGLGKPFSVWTEGAWQTPLGKVEIDGALAEKIVAISQFFEADVDAHLEEHAVEVQLPFLQYFKPDVRIVPVILYDAPVAAYQQMGKDIARAIKELKKDAVIMASGDMTHHESAAAAKEKDLSAVEAMLALDIDELTRRYKTRRISMCAYPSVVCTIAAAKELGCSGAELVKYQSSGDATGDYDDVVAYAGVIFKGGPHASDS